MAASRIVSLLPAATEIACALGLREHLVGRSHECDFPPGIEALPPCTRSRVAGSTSREIDTSVRERARAGISLYEVDEPLLASLEPSVILTQDQCDVCAVSLESVEQAVARTVPSKPRILSLAPSTLGDVFSDIRRVAESLGRPEKSKELLGELSHRVSGVGEKTGALSNRPRVACIEWFDPLMVSANWVPELVRVAGGEPLFLETGEASARIQLGDLVTADPDVIVLLPCGFDIARARGEISALEERPGWSELSAVRSKRVFVVDGNAYFNRPGPRLVDSLEILAEIVHPDRFEPTRRGDGWQPL